MFNMIATLVVAFGGLLAVLVTRSHPALGLDLQGGVSVTKQPVGSFNDAALDLTVERLRERVDALGVAEPEIIRQDDTVVVNLPGVKDQQEAIRLTNISGKVYLRPVLGCQEIPRTDETQATTLTTTPTTTAGTTGSSPVGTTPGTTLGTIPAPAGTSAQGWKRSTPATSPGSTPATAPVSTSATPPVAPDGSTPDSAADPNEGFGPTDPTTTQLRPIRPSADVSGGVCQVGPAGGTGEVFEEDAVARVVSGQGWIVTVSLRDGAGQQTWDTLAQLCYSGSTTCPSRQLAIELDGQIISHPVVNQPRFAGGQVEISGNFSERDAKDLAKVLESGALPVELETVAVQNVSPTLGQDSLDAAIVSGLVGVVLVLGLMMLYYRLLGLIAVAGLIVSSAILWTIVSVLSRTQGLALSLSGIAGLIISVGVTIDSYVVFFERLKDEVQAGRTMRNATQKAFSDAWRTILIADLVSLIGALVLWYLTVGSVRNFAFFLGLSTLIDLAVTWFFVKPAVLLLSRTDWMARRKVMGVTARTAGGVA